MTPEAHTVILVSSTSHALRAEKLLHRAGMRSKLIPVPRHLSADCGVCLGIAQPEREAAQQALEDVGMEIDGIHDV